MAYTEENLIKSKDRVTNHGEVFTSEREVNAMLDLVKQETERIESRFLEPACGHGNFLIKILERKLNVVESKYKNSQMEYERYGVLAVSSIYGVDLQEDNVIEARDRLLGYITSKYRNLFKTTVNGQFLNSIKYILTKNLVTGDALTMRNNTGEPIIFPEWSLVNGSNIKRRDFSFATLLENQEKTDQTLSMPMFSDLGEDVFLPDPIKEYPVKHFLKVEEYE